MENQEFLQGDIETLINMALVASEKPGLEFTKKSQNFQALYEIIGDWVAYFGVFQFESKFVEEKQQVSVTKTIPIVKSALNTSFPIDDYFNSLQNFFTQDHIWRNSDYLQEEHIRIIFYLHARRYQALIKATQEKGSKKTWSNDSKPSVSAFCSMDLYLEFGPGANSVENLCIELKLLTKSDLEDTSKGIDTEISNTGKRRKHRERGCTTIRLLLNSALEQIRSYYDFSKLDAEVELRIPRYAVIVTPFNLFNKFSENGYVPLPKDMTKISHQAVKDVFSKFQFQIFACEFQTRKEFDDFKVKLNNESSITNLIEGWIIKQITFEKVVLAFKTKTPLGYFHLCGRLESESIRFFESEDELKNYIDLEKLSFLNELLDVELQDSFKKLGI